MQLGAAKALLVTAIKQGNKAANASLMAAGAGGEDSGEANGAAAADEAAVTD